MIRPKSVPVVLQERFETLAALYEAYDLLEVLKRAGVTSGPEIDYLQDNVKQYSSALESSEEECSRALNRISWHQKAWVCAKMRYMDGIKWDEIAETELTRL